MFAYKRSRLAFSKKRNFVTVKVFNMIGYEFRSNEDKNQL